MNKFKKVDDIPEFPHYNSQEEYQKLVKDFIGAGSIPKSDLISGEWYIGQSRSTNIAQWFPQGGFHFIRYKMDGMYVDNIPHFEEDRGTDVFIPFKLIEI